MTNRREVLQMSMAVTLLPIDAIAGWATPSAGAGRGTPVVPLYKAFYDTRFAASQAFGERMAAQGVATTAVAGGDITALWYDTLYPLWQKTPVPIAGLTARGPLFCLERLAWDHGMRVMFRAQHSLTNGGAIQHEIEGPDALVELARRVAVEGSWAAGLGDVIGQYPGTGGPKAQVQVHTARPTVQLPEGEALFSWVIAPVARS